MGKLNKLLLLVAVAISGTAFATASDYTVEFGPYVGTGSSSDGAKVRHASGYALTVDRGWKLSDSLTLGPRIELSNGFINMKKVGSTSRYISSYDNRTVAAGLRFSALVGNKYTLAREVYVSAVGGNSFSKLAVDESNNTTYIQNLYGDIKGKYFATELGAWLPLREDLGLNVAFLASTIKADQSKASGSYEGDEVRDGTVYSLTGEHTPEDNALDDTIILRTNAIKLSISLGF